MFIVLVIILLAAILGIRNLVVYAIRIKINELCYQSKDPHQNWVKYYDTLPSYEKMLFQLPKWSWKQYVSKEGQKELLNK